MSYDIWLTADLGGPEPITLSVLSGWNYTSNVSPMWRLAMPETDGLYGFDGKPAGEVLPVLVRGIRAMEDDPATYRALNPSNGWGSYDTQLAALRELREAFEAAPKAIVRVSA